MKKRCFFLLLSLFSLSVTKAQVPNPSFEEFTGYGNETRFWGANPIFIPVTIDMNGNSISDTILYDEDANGSCFYNNEAHSGSRAMEIRNAFNVTKNEVIPGKMILFNESEGNTTPSGWNTGYPAAEGTVLDMLGFYYKFLPVGNDVAEATMEVFGESGLIGTASVEITQTTSDFEYVYTPITYTSTESPVFVTVTFSMAKEGSTPAMGSRLVIDDVITDFSALNIPANDGSKISIYPTVAVRELNIDTKGILQGAVTYKIFTSEGKMVKQNVVSNPSGYVYSMDVTSLSSGVYFITIESSIGSFTKKFLKK